MLRQFLPHVKSQVIASALVVLPNCLRLADAFIQQRNFDQIMHSKERHMPPQSHRKAMKSGFFRFMTSSERLDSIQHPPLHRKKDQKWKVELIYSLMPILSEELTNALINAVLGYSMLGN